MKRYRKKPVVIDAVQWDGTPEGATPIIDEILSTSDQAARYHEEIPPKLHSIYCRCDGYGRVPNPAGPPSLPCPETEPQGPTAPAYIAIDTLEGVMTVVAGSWVIRGIKGEFYPCLDEIFAETYDLVEGP